MGDMVAIPYIELIDDGFGTFEPVIEGRKITVHEIVSMHLMGGSSVAWICENFDLTPSQIHAALLYYYDHQAQIDREIQADIEDFPKHGVDAREHLEKIYARAGMTPPNKGDHDKS